MTADPMDRSLGMLLGAHWDGHADLVAVYTDRGISYGMKAAIERARELGIPPRNERHRRPMIHHATGIICGGLPTYCGVRIEWSESPMLDKPGETKLVPNVTTCPERVTCETCRAKYREILGSRR